MACFFLPFSKLVFSIRKWKNFKGGIQRGDKFKSQGGIFRPISCENKSASAQTSQLVDKIDPVRLGASRRGIGQAVLFTGCSSSMYQVNELRF